MTGLMQIIAQRRRSAGAFSPISLFSNGEKGGFWDFTDLSSLWQDTAGTSAVTTSGQSIKRANDLSGNGNHVTENTNPPVYDTTDGIQSCKFNGVSSILKKSSFNLSGCEKLTVVVGLRQRSFSTSASAIISHGTFFSNIENGGIEVFQNNSVSGAIGMGVGSSNSSYYVSNGPAATSSTRMIVWSGKVFPLKSDVRRMTMRLNSDEVQETFVSQQGSLSTSIFSTRSFSIGGRSSGSIYADCDIIGCLIIGRELTEAETRAAELFFSEKCGLSLGHPYFNIPISWDDSIPSIDKNEYYVTNPFAKIDYQTDATLFRVQVWNNIYGSYPDLCKIGVLINGIYHSSIAPSSTGGYTYHDITLPSGFKVVSFVNGPQSGSDPAVRIGSFVSAVQANKYILRLTQNNLNRAVFYGDSISVGANSTDPQTNAWVAQVRASRYPFSTMLEGRGFRNLYEDCSDGIARSAFVSKIVNLNPSIFWIAMGTNDYGLNKWSAASFGAAYGSLLDDLHIALPSLKIYCQTPLLRSSEVANGSGSTLGDYRTQISTAAAARPGYCTFVDGTAIMTTSSLADGLHPNNSGMDLYAAYVLNILG